MKLRVLIAALALATTPMAAIHAQNAGMTTKQVTAKSFDASVNAFEQEKDQAKSGALLKDLVGQMNQGLAASKMGIATAQTAGNETEAKRMLDKYNGQLSIIQKVSQLNATLPTFKSDAVKLLKQFSSTL